MATATDDNAAYEKSGKSIWRLLNFRCARACLKKACCKMCVTICGRFCPDEGVVAGYDNRIRVKYTAKWGVQIAGMIFQTRSSYCGKVLIRTAFFLLKCAFEKTFFKPIPFPRNQTLHCIPIYALL